MATRLQRIESPAAALERGRVEYASGRFYRAHAVWLDPWRGAAGAERRLFQGLIQAAGAYLKLGAGNPAGMAILIDQALAQLGPLADDMGGLDLAGFRIGLRRSRAEAAAWRAGGPAPNGPAWLARTRAAPVQAA